MTQQSETDNKVDDEDTPPPESIRGKMPPELWVVRGLRKRSSELRRFGIIYFILMLCAIVALCSLFVRAENQRVDSMSKINDSYERASSSLNRLERGNSAATTGKSDTSLELSLIRQTFESGIRKATAPWNGSDLIGITTRVGAVFVLLYFVKIMVALNQSNFRQAAVCDAQANVLHLVKLPDFVELEGWIHVFRMSADDLAKPIDSPSDQVVAVGKGIAEKFTSKLPA